MVIRATRILGITLQVVLDESGNGFEHESGAVLEFKGRDVQSYSLEWDGRRELVLMLKKVDDHELLIKGIWECFFKALSMEGESEDFSVLSKSIYVESFLDHCHMVQSLVDEMWKEDNFEFYEEPDWFIDHDEQNFEG